MRMLTMRLTTLLLLGVMTMMMITGKPGVQAVCDKTPSGLEYPLVMGMLSATSRSNLDEQNVVLQQIAMTGSVQACFENPLFLNLGVADRLRIPTHGWSEIENGIKDALDMVGAAEGVKPTILVGPFYTNLAMVAQRMNVPYMITYYEGFDWIDMSRVQDTVNWKTIIEIQPSAHAQNQAVVDLFIHRNWISAMMVMPENAADNQECQNLASQMLNNSLSLIPFTVEPRSHNINIDLQELLRNAKIFRQSQIIVCSPRDSRDELIQKILQAARPFGLLGDEDFSFIFVDPSSILMPFSGASEMYSLGLFSARCELLAFRYIKPKITHASVTKSREKHSEQYATARDAGKVIAEALYRYINTQTRLANNLNHTRFLEALRKVHREDSETGNIQFDEHGHRFNYTLDLYNHGGEAMYKRMATWDPSQPTPETRLNVTSSDEEDESYGQIGIFPEVVKIVLVKERPFVMEQQNSYGVSRGIDRFEGFTIDLIKRLARELKFKYEVYLSPGNRYGGPLENGDWDGMVGEILAGRATMACGSISITSTRESVIDFSLGVLSTGVNILVKKPKESFTIFQFMKPFSLELWMAILGATATVSLVFFVMDYCSGENRRFTVRETVWFTIGTLLKRGTDFAPVPISQRILTAGFLFFVLITVSTYTANMAAFLTIKNFGEIIDSFQSLAENDELGVCTVKQSATESFLRRGTDPIFRSLWGKVQRSHCLVEGAQEGVERVAKGGVAFMFDFLINEAAENINCDVMDVGTPILLQEHGIGMRAGAPFKSSVNFALLKLKEEGFMAGLKKKWWDDKRKCDIAGDSQRSGQVQFGLQHTAGVFVVGLFGVCVSALLFLNKKIYWSIRRAVEKKMAQRKARKGKLSSTTVGSDPNNDVTKRERQKLFQGDKGEAV